MPGPEFIERFTNRFTSALGPTFADDGSSVEEYARSIAPSYYEASDLRGGGPEVCANMAMGY